MTWPRGYLLYNWKNSGPCTRMHTPIAEFEFRRTTRKVLGTFLKILNARITVLTMYSGTSQKSKTENWSRNFHTTSGSSSKMQVS